MRLAVCLTALILYASPAVAAPAAPGGSEEFADWLYAAGRFRDASMEYRRLLQVAPSTLTDGSRFRNKLALSEMRAERFREAADALSIDAPDFAGRYLRMYATLRLGLTQSALFERSRIANEPSTPKRSVDETDLLAGTVLLEKGTFLEAARHYRELRRRTEDEQVKKVSSDVLVSINDFLSGERKRGWLAGTLSALLPGAGQYYAGHDADAVSAFFFNAMFLGSTVALYDLENRAGAPHMASLVYGVVALIFYAANITGAIGSAHRYNIHQERLFQEKIRTSFFNLERVEQVADIHFQKRF